MHGGTELEAAFVGDKTLPDPESTVIRRERFLLTLHSMKKMKNTASVGTIGHFDMVGLEGQEDMKIDEITPPLSRLLHVELQEDMTCVRQFVRQVSPPA